MSAFLIHFLSALGLVFVLEGIMPFAFPERWKALLKKVMQQDDKTLRTSGFFSMMLGIIVLTVIHQFIE